jgi:outer membrane immunogenic protein
MIKRAFAVSAALLCSPVYANDFPGARIEANFGWDHLGGKLSYTDSAFPEDNFVAKESTDGFVYGGTIGYDFRIQKGIYAGVEASVDFADNKRCEPVFGNDSACFKAKRNFAIGGRLGGSVTKDMLVYAGVALVNARATASYSDFIDPSYDFSISDSRAGYRVSAGTEVHLTGNAFAKLEYRYSDYGNYSISAGSTKTSLGFDRHQVIGGLGYRF